MPPYCFYSNLAPFCIFGPSGLFLRPFRAFCFGCWGQVQNQFWGLLFDALYFGLGSTELFFVFNLATFGAFSPLFVPLGLIIGIGVRFRNFLETYLHKLITFI